jgi:hypothetical protein
MQLLTPTGQNIVNNVAQRYNLSQDAVMCMLTAVNNGRGSMAQFNCPELGGSGQWMRGGMTMVGDMFNYGLKNTVNNLCAELSNALVNTQMFPVPPAGSPNSNQWWPSNLGSPFSSGAQNNIRYAVFPNRLAIQFNGQVTVYNTLDNNISGISQQQGGNTSLTFSSQYGTIAVNTLPVVSGPGMPAQKQTNFVQPTQGPNQFEKPSNIINKMNDSYDNPSSADEIISLIEKIAKLHQAGALTDEEFNTKKSELLSRI